jgi:hypothetical protein
MFRVSICPSSVVQYSDYRIWCPAVKMGILMPETCWAKEHQINFICVESSWFFTLPKFITVFTKIKPSNLSRVIWICSDSSHLISHPRLCISCYLLFLCFLPRIMSAFPDVRCVGQNAKENVKTWRTWISHDSESDEERQFSSHFCQNLTGLILQYGSLNIVVRPEVQTSAGLPPTPNNVFPSCALFLEEKVSLASLNKDPVLNPYFEITLHYVQIIFYSTRIYQTHCRTQWQRDRRRKSAASRLLRPWVRIPPEAWMSVVSVVCCQVEVFAKGWSLVQGSPTDWGTSLCLI